MLIFSLTCAKTVSLKIPSQTVNERFYEKVIKVKADVAASLIPSELTKSY